ncbi:DUF4350 domain-containing protein [Micromonospora zhanjiangensis]|uniref:DUF4350 domain-containing protein n=1 Tax=Micromonospora zhanjiangensis TaxID=1522057 RepID=A0ABV8KRE5_9ACTN
MTARVRGSRRWHRIALPFLVLVLLYLVTGVAHGAQEPDLADPGTLSPTGTGPDGSSRLAELLAGNGVTVHRVTSSAEALRLLDSADLRPDPTVFVPAPDLVTPGFFEDVADDRTGFRLVLAYPGSRAALYAGFLTGPQRWAARTAEPGCGTDFAVAAGPAAVLRARYQAPEQTRTDCYGGGLVGWGDGDSEILAVGATDPFRNGRIGEAGNASLATGLLGRDRDVIWVDVHRRESSEALPPPKFKLPGYRQPNRDSGGTDPQWHAFPPVLWAAVVLLSTVAVLVALVRGRRLGPPVAEPLPVVVPATETVTGRGRLYQRIRSREASLATLRAAALRRMTPVFDPYHLAGPGGAGGDEELIRHIAARTGIPDAEVRTTLHGPEPASDDEFQSAVDRLDALVAAVLRVGPGPTGTTGPVNPGGAA